MDDCGPAPLVRPHLDSLSITLGLKTSDEHPLSRWLDLFALRSLQVHYPEPHAAPGDFSDRVQALLTTVNQDLVDLTVGKIANDYYGGIVALSTRFKKLRCLSIQPDYDD